MGDEAGGWECPNGHPVLAGDTVCRACGVQRDHEEPLSLAATHHPGSAPEDNESPGDRAWQLTRRIVRGLLIGMAAIAALSLGFSESWVARSSDIAMVLRSSEENNSRAQGAPQQQVVNGWAARDLLALQVDRADLLIEEQRRTNQLLAILTATLAVGMLLGRRERS